MSLLSRLIRTGLVGLLLAAALAPSAHAQGAYLTTNLSLEDEGAEVALLQTWLAADPDIYPEGIVSGVFGPATKRAVERYQEREGMILGVPGAIGAMTRANLNADYSDTKGGVAAVEAKYGDALAFNGEEFVRLTEVEYVTETEAARARLDVWTNPYALVERDTSILENGDGYGVGFTQFGKLYAITPKAKAITESVYAKEGEWQHVAILFLADDAVFIYDNKVVEVVSYTDLPDRNFLALITSRIVDTIGALFAGQEDAQPPALSQAEMREPVGIGSIFNRALQFFGLGREDDPAPIASEPLSPEPAPAEVETPVTSVPAVAPSPKPAVTLAPAPAPAEAPSPLMIGKATTSVVAIATTTAATTTATTTATATTSTSSGGSSSGGSSGNGTPVITLSGSASVSIGSGSVYSDPGATAKDAEDGDLTNKIVVGGDTINYNIPGDYRITYNVTDSSGKKAKEVVRTVTVTSPPEYPVSQQQPNYPLAPAGQTVSYSVSNASDADPKFVSVEIKPLHVYVGDTQTFTVKVSSASGVKSVESTTELDTTTLDLPLTKTASDASGDTYSASWIVYDTHTQIYHTTFTAKSNGGKENSITMAWSDPCSGITQGSNSSVSSSSFISRSAPAWGC